MELLLYHPGFDCLMIAYQTYERSHWYTFINDPYGYEGTAAHKIRFLVEELGWVVLDKWKKPSLEDIADFYEKRMEERRDKINDRKDTTFA